MEDFFRKTGVVSIVSAIIFAVVGAILMFNSEAILKIICYILGIIFIVVGGFRIVAHFAAKGKYNIYNWGFASGVIALVSGLIVIFASDVVIKVLGIVIGLWIMYSALVRLELMIKLRKIKSEFWISVAVTSAIMLVCGLYMIMNPEAAPAVMGLIVFVYGVLDFIQSIIYMNTLKKIM